MTQTLINTLNILPETNVNLTNKMSKSAGMDFGKLFENKTGEIRKISDGSKPKQITSENDKKCIKQETVNAQKNDETKKSDTVNGKNTDKLTNDTSKTKDTSATDNMSSSKTTQQQDTVKEVKENNSKTAENNDENELIEDNTEIIEITITDEESEDSDEITVTEKEPTMYNELITLEDPTALLMLQTQIQKNVTLNSDDEQIIDDNNANTNTQSSGKNLNSADTSGSKEVLKQFNVQIKKGAEIINKTPAEITRSKIDTHKSSNVLNEKIIKELNVEVLSSQSSGAESSMGDLMQNQSPQEQAARIMIQGDIKYETVASEAAKNVTQTKTANISPGRIIEQISKQLESMFNNSKLNMVLNPGSLGKLNLQLINSKEGILAQFTVTTQEARDVLMKGLSGLKESLLAHGVNVDNVSVKLESSEGESENDYTEQEGSRGGYKRQGEKRQKNDGKNFEEMMFNLENEGNV